MCINSAKCKTKIPLQPNDSIFMCNEVLSLSYFSNDFLLEGVWPGLPFFNIPFITIVGKYKGGRK